MLTIFAAAETSSKLQRMATEPSVAPVGSEAEDEDDDDGDMKDFVVNDDAAPDPLGPRLTPCRSMFMPVFTVGYWDDPADSYSPCASVNIWSFSGLDKSSDFSINVVNSCVEFTAVWPEEMTTAEILHGVWMNGTGGRQKIAAYHPMVTCFDAMLAPLRRHDGRVHTVTKIPVKMRVESRPEVHLLKFPNSTLRLIYVILRGPAKKTIPAADSELVWE